MSEVYILRVKRPAGVSKPEMQRYIRDSVNGWKGGFDPSDPLTTLPRVSVKSARIVQPPLSRARVYI